MDKAILVSDASWAQKLFAVVTQSKRSLSRLQQLRCIRGEAAFAARGGLFLDGGHLMGVRVTDNTKADPVALSPIKKAEFP